MEKFGSLLNEPTREPLNKPTSQRSEKAGPHNNQKPSLSRRGLLLRSIGTELTQHWSLERLRCRIGRGLITVPN